MLSIFTNIRLVSLSPLAAALTALAFIVCCRAQNTFAATFTVTIGNDLRKKRRRPRTIILYQKRKKEEQNQALPFFP